MVTKAMRRRWSRASCRAATGRTRAARSSQPARAAASCRSRRDREGGRLTRLDLARWITSPENPLTARVFVNRLWKQFFGTGISSLVEDLGAQGEWPVHPELLDWLAVEFRDGGWDVKHMVKLMVMSAAYRQDSRAPARAARGRPGQPPARVAVAAAARSRVRPRQRPGDRRAAQPRHRRPERLPLSAGRLLRQPPVPRPRLRRRSRTSASTAAASTCTGSGRSSTRCWPTSTPRRARSAPPPGPSPTRRSRP